MDAPGTLHHLIVRGIDGVSLFLDHQDRTRFLSRLSDLVPQTGTRIVAWALMDSHVHLLIFSGQAGISKFMRRLLTGYAIEYNRKYHRQGHLFQNRYKSIVCEEDSYLMELIRYIHLNPLRAGVVRTLGDLDDYPWSGHGVLIGRRRNIWQDREYVLRQFSEDVKRAIRSYRRFMAEGQHQGKREELIGGGLRRSLGGWSQVVSLRGASEPLAHDARILGGTEFVRKIWDETEGDVRRQLRIGDLKELIDQRIREICREEGVNEIELRRGGQRRDVSRTRAEIAYRLNHEQGISFAEIARQTGVCATAVLKAVRKRQGRSEKS